LHSQGGHLKPYPCQPNDAFRQIPGGATPGTGISVRLRLRLLAILLPLGWTGPAGAVELDFGIVKILERLSLPVPDPARPVVCHGFGCAYQTPILLRPNDHAQLKKLFGAAADPVDERRALAAAVAWYERRVAAEAGTARAKARAGLGSAGDPSQFDCLDKTSNTIGLLTVIAKMGLLRHHEIDTPESRGGIGSLPHTTAVVRERGNGRKWVIDGWTHNNGEMPDVMPLETWRTQS